LTPPQRPITGSSQGRPPMVTPRAIPVLHSPPVYRPNPARIAVQAKANENRPDCVAVPATVIVPPRPPSTRPSALPAKIGVAQRKVPISSARCPLPPKPFVPRNLSPVRQHTCPQASQPAIARVGQLKTTPSRAQLSAFGGQKVAGVHPAQSAPFAKPVQPAVGYGQLPSKNTRLPRHANGTIQRQLILRDDFNAWRNNDYRRGWRTFEQAVANQRYFRYVRDSANTSLRVSVEQTNRRYGNTKMWIRRTGVWYDVDVDDTDLWSRAPSDAPIEIWIKIAHNLSEHEISETLAHEWNCHGRAFAEFAQFFRDGQNTSRDIRDEWRQGNARDSYLHCGRQHDDLGQRNNSYMRRTIRQMTSYLEGYGLFTRADDLYNEYRTDVADHQ